MEGEKRQLQLTFAVLTMSAKSVHEFQFPVVELIKQNDDHSATNWATSYDSRHPLPNARMDRLTVAAVSVFTMSAKSVHDFQFPVVELTKNEELQ